MRVLPANFLDVEQGSSAWFDARLGCVTSSRVEDAISYLKRKSKNGNAGDETAARKRLKTELVSEILTGEASEHYVSIWMEWGKENEPLGRAAYELIKGADVTQVGFALHTSINRAGASPDGLVGDKGLIEIKCPKTGTHIDYLVAGIVPEDYKPQMYWQMACCEREWCDFVSHDPRLPEEYQTFIVRLERDDKAIAEMEQEVNRFLAEVDEMLEKLKCQVSGESYIERKLKQSIERISK